MQLKWMFLGQILPQQARTRLRRNPRWLAGLLMRIRLVKRRWPPSMSGALFTAKGTVYVIGSGSQRRPRHDCTPLPHQLHELADLIADRIAARYAGELIDATELAKRIGRSRDYVYANADALGALRLGDGPRPRLMFPRPLGQLEQPATVKATDQARPPQRRSTADAVGLLPIKGTL